MKTILVVDDIPMMRAITRNIISQLGIPCEVIEAGSSGEAMIRLARDRIDLILLDWNMPDSSGLNFLKTARGLKFNVPIIMVTGEADRAKVIEAIQKGATDYLVKPVTQEVLREKLQKIPGFWDPRGSPS